MKKHSFRFDVLRDRPLKVVCCIGFPLLIVNVVSFFTTAVTNEIYLNFCGQIYFTVNSLLGSIITLFGNVTAGVVTAAWIKTSAVFLNEKTRKRSLRDALFAICIWEIFFVAVLLILSKYILIVLKVPEEAMSDALLYFRVNISVHLLSSIGSYLLQALNVISNALEILIVNLVNMFAGMGLNALFLAVFRLGLVGAATLSGICGLFTSVCVLLCIHRKKSPQRREKERFWPDMKQVGRIIGYGMIIALQCVLCSIGNFLLNRQANKLLSQDYLSTLSIGFPINAVFNSVSIISTTVFSANYAAGESARVKSFLRIMLTSSVIYSAICFAMYACFAEFYFRHLFDSEELVGYGKEVWLWQGLSTFPLGLICVVRYLFDSVGLNKVALFSGVNEFIGYTLCAYLFIPYFGTVGRSIAACISWGLASCYLLIAYLILRKRIYRKCQEIAQKAEAVGTDEGNSDTT